MEFAGLTAGHPCPFGVLNALIIHSDFPEICLTPHVSHIWQIDEKE